ncbi:hypothetical protein [Pleomorphovibrio marinus]|uniref:hypothetical protein n=1 Tax=Pleomorphovibrio marinus TaxID=2164132 RepID=UPI000E0BC253|nr:hypothetical protein [Pleomorphovibrio marinus]
MIKTILPITLFCLAIGICSGQDVVGFEQPMDPDGPFYQEAESFQYDDLLSNKITLTEMKIPSDIDLLQPIMMPPIKVFPGMSPNLPEEEEMQKNEMRQPKDPEYFPQRKFYLTPPTKKSESDK